MKNKGKRIKQLEFEIEDLSTHVVNLILRVSQLEREFELEREIAQSQNRLQGLLGYKAVEPAPWKIQRPGPQPYTVD